MPCFKGIAVSVHAEGAPLPEFAVTKQSRVSRISTYIPVPPPRVPKDSTSTKAEPSRFAISITLLTPGLPVPYSTPKPTADNPYPRPQIVAGLPGIGIERASYGAVVGPYMPITKSDNETIAAYIYFDGRTKEEVATLLRPGEETWVNSRWVQVPDSEGGGLAEREFLFREVGLERWLNGLDLEGSDANAKIERRRQKFEKRRRRLKQEHESDDEMDATTKPKDVLKYGGDANSPVEKVSDDDILSDWDSDNDEPPPEAAGQIKVAMFRVLASGEIRRGEYSPQFDAHDDDDMEEGGAKSNNGAEEADIDHTTSFAKPKTLDPKSISTQTVTGIDGPDKPYAVFTFFYRGERQLQKMGIVDTTKQSKTTPSSAKRSSTQLNFSSLPPLKSGGTVGFSAFRDNDARKARKRSNGSIGAAGAMEEDSDDDEDDKIVGEMEDIDDKDVKTLLSPEDAKFGGELADGVGRIKLKRQHSAEPLNGNARKSPATVGGSPIKAEPEDLSNPANTTATTSALDIPNNNARGSASPLPDDSVVGSPLKKQRANGGDLSATDDTLKLPPPISNVLGLAESAQATQQQQSQLSPSVYIKSEEAIKKEEEEEL